MSCRSRKKNKRAGRYDLLGREEDVNPLSYISNLSDAMLVLAVGIMVALVVNWNVDLTNYGDTEEDEDSEPAVVLNSNELEDQDRLPDSALHTGEVYYDAETDTYYIVKERASK